MTIIKERQSPSRPSDQRDGNDWYLSYFRSTIISVTCIKILLIPAYYSTDMEVHRNWMAITYQKPLVRWYTENTSKWTLDYPPFFAYFQYFTALLAPYFDPEIVNIRSDPYTSRTAVYYMRSTVIVSDIVYYYGVYLWIRLMFQKKRSLFAWIPPSPISSISSSFLIPITLFLFNVGHLIVDHIHFQYNGFLNGILLISMAQMANDQIYWSAFWFTVLLNLKHIYLYLAPAYFLYLLFDHCIHLPSRKSGGSLRIRFDVLFRLAIIVLSVFTVSFGPFVWNGQIWNVLNRMFPFQRGLSHAYWCPNVWALYNGADLVLARLTGSRRTSPFTSGLVQQSEHLVLPSVTPQFCLSLIIIVLTGVGLSYSWKRMRNDFKSESPIRFLHLALISSMTFYEFGYHVHEKAILLVIPILIPLLLVKLEYTKFFLIISTTGYYSLFPLLHQESETMIKLLLLMIHVVFSFGMLSKHYRIIFKMKKINNDDSIFKKLSLLNSIETFYIYGFIPLQLFYTGSNFFMPELFEKKFPFLSLMFISIYCSIGIFYIYIRSLKMFFRI